MDHELTKVYEFTKDKLHMYVFSAKGYENDPNEVTVFMNCSWGQFSTYRAYRLDKLDYYINYESQFHGPKYSARVKGLTWMRNHLLGLAL